MIKTLIEKSLPSLSIADDELSLTTTDGDERIDGFDTSLHGFAYGYTRDNTRSFNTDTSTVNNKNYKMS